MGRVPGGCSTVGSVPVSARAIAHAHKAHALSQWLTRGLCSLLVTSRRSTIIPIYR